MIEKRNETCVFHQTAFLNGFYWMMTRRRYANGCASSTGSKKRRWYTLPSQSAEPLGIQRHIRLQKQSNTNLMNDPEFLPLTNLVDSLYRKLHLAGIGVSVKKTIALSNDNEEKIWTNGVLNPDTPPPKTC